MKDDIPHTLLLLACAMIVFCYLLSGKQVKEDNFHSAGQQEYLIIQENSIKAPNTPYIPRIEVMGTLMRIIEAESGNNHLAKNPHSSAYGLCQMIKTTRDYVEKNIGKIDWSSYDDQLRACKWLYEKQGTKPWRASERIWGN